METWIRELREVIRNGGPVSRADARAMACNAATHIPDRQLAAPLEVSLREALNMITLADEFGYGAMARQHALGVLAKIGNAAGH